MAEPRFLTIEEVIELHVDQIEAFGGMHGIRDAGLLESAVEMPQTGAFGDYYHSDLFEMAAAYLFHLVMNHPFLDGNTRVGLYAALEFRALNGIDVDLGDDAAYQLVIDVAEGTIAKADVARLLREHSQLTGGAEGGAD